MRDYVKIGRVFIGGEEIGEVIDFIYTSSNKKDDDNCNIIWKNKIDKSLGLTHGVKNNRLYRK